MDKSAFPLYDGGMKVAVYYRVSTGAQAGEDRFGLPAQREAVETYCKRHKHEIVAVYEDAGYSGATADRPDLAKMLHDAAHEDEHGRKPPFDAVVVAKFDRLARKAMLDGYIRFSLKKNGVSVVSATEETEEDDPQSQLMQAMLAAFAEFERSLITARLAGGRRVKRARGEYAEGRPRYGMRAEGKALVVDEDEAEIVKMMRTLRKQGKTYREIADKLNDKGFAPRHGSTWRHSTVHNVLKRLEKPRRKMAKAA